MEIIDFNFTRLGDFNEVIEYYRNLLELIKLFEPLEDVMTEDKWFDLDLTYFRVMLNNIGLSIGRNFDYIEENQPKNINKFILSKLHRLSERVSIGNTSKDEKEEFLKRFESAFENLMKDNGLSAFETLKQIRNALLHGDYDIRLEENKVYEKSFISDEAEIKANFYEGPKNIYLKSKNMEGVLPYEETVMFLDLFYNIIRKDCTLGPREFTVANPLARFCKSDIMLNDYIESLQSYYITAKGSTEKGNILNLVFKYPYVPQLRERLMSMEKVNKKNYFGITKIEPEEMLRRKKDLKEYIEYIGLDRWEYCYLYGVENEILENVFFSRLNGTTTTLSLGSKFASLVYLWFASERKNEKMSESERLSLLAASFQQPLIYTDLILGLLNYTGAYVRANSVLEDSVFEYHNLKGLKRIKPIIDNGETKSIKHKLSGKEKQSRIDSVINGCISQLNNLGARIEDTKDRLSKLHYKDPKKEEKEEKYKLSIESDEKKKAEVESKKERFVIRRKEYSRDYSDYSELFRHLRNSIAHGYYDVDYSRVFKKGELDKVRFVFYDYNEDNLEKEEPDFKIILTADQIFKIVDSIQKRVNKQLEREKNLDKIAPTTSEHILENVEIENSNENNVFEEESVKKDDKIGVESKRKKFLMLEKLRNIKEKLIEEGRELEDKERSLNEDRGLNE